MYVWIIFFFFQLESVKFDLGYFQTKNTCEGCLRDFTTLINIEHLRKINCFYFFEKENEKRFGRRCINIGLKNVAVAVARVVELFPRCSNKGVKSVDVYKTFARIICCTTGAARAAKWPSLAFHAPEPHRASSVWGTRFKCVAHNIRWWWRVTQNNVYTYKYTMNCV